MLWLMTKRSRCFISFPFHPSSISPASSQLLLFAYLSLCVPLCLCQLTDFPLDYCLWPFHTFVASVVAYSCCVLHFAWVFVFGLWPLGLTVLFLDPYLAVVPASWHLANCIFCCIIVIYAAKSLCLLCCVFICILHSSSSWTQSWQSSRENHRPCRHIVSKEELNECFRVRNGSGY